MNRNPGGLHALGSVLRALRAEHTEALSQDRLALASRIDRTHYASIERGEVNPTFEVLWAIVAGLGTNWETLGRELDKQPALRKRPLTRADIPAPKRGKSRGK